MWRDAKVLGLAYLLDIPLCGGLILACHRWPGFGQHLSSFLVGVMAYLAADKLVSP